MRGGSRRNLGRERPKHPWPEDRRRTPRRTRGVLVWRAQRSGVGRTLSKPPWSRARSGRDGGGGVGRGDAPRMAFISGRRRARPVPASRPGGKSPSANPARLTDGPSGCSARLTDGPSGDPARLTDGQSGSPARLTDGQSGCPARLTDGPSGCPAGLTGTNITSSDDFGNLSPIWISVRFGLGLQKYMIENY